MRDDETSALLAIRLVKAFYRHNQLRIYLNKKSREYLSSVGISVDLAVREALRVLSRDSYYRGPSAVHGQKNSDVDVYEFLTVIYDGNIYIKFFVSAQGAELHSFHPAERFPDETFTKFR